MSVATIPAADLVQEGRCNPLCLVARDADRHGKCRCRCQGEFHGALADAPVEASRPTRWWEACGHGGWNLDACIVERQGRATRQPRGGDPLCYVRDCGSEFSVAWDGLPMRLPDHEIRSLWPRRESALLNRITHSLLRQARIRYGMFAPGSYLSTTGFQHLDEARTFALVIGECFAGNPCGAVRAIEVLEGRPDPTSLGLNPEDGYPEELAFVNNPADDWRRA